MAEENQIPPDIVPLFPHPLDEETTVPALTFREQYLRQFSQAIRNKPNWTEKVLDRSLLVKWLRETQLQNRIAGWHKVVTWNKEDIAFVYKELVEGYKPYVEELRKDEKNASVEPDMDCVWRSDNLVDEALKKELIDAVATLENVPDEQKDWHPGSDNQVLDLVHPSLWPVIYGRSINLTTGKPIQLPDSAIDDSYSDQFCWLPAEFEVGLDGKTKIASYINNLSSPGQRELFYPILERIFERFVPLFDHVLADLVRKMDHMSRVPSPGSYDEDSEDVEWLLDAQHKEKWEELLGQFERGEELTVDFAEHVEVFSDDDADGEEQREKYESQYWSSDDEHRAQGFEAAPYQIRDLGTLTDSMWTPPVIEESCKLQGKTAKVIVKLANIVLTPETPIYSGGSWHVEAMMNERIISTGIYYYAQENITDSALAFRRTLDDIEELQYELPQDSNWTTMHDMGREGNSVQEIGGIQTKENRAIAFPNIFQHHVQPFELVDKEKPGYRKILVFFLCDPTNECTAPTSKIVAPQQPEARKDVEEALRYGPLGKLPEEVFRLIVEELPAVVSREEAEKYRGDLMKERASYIQDSTAVQGTGYAL
ncbi:hypothetical protein ABW20_dc0110083 [Dactylellina cionopaga]|nr:hypothetical protein ABW20_dc0110083 [Dactylellina cionopaga]